MSVFANYTCNMLKLNIYVESAHEGSNHKPHMPPYCTSATTSSDCTRARVAGGGSVVHTVCVLLSGSLSFLRFTQSYDLMTVLSEGEKEQRGRRELKNQTLGLKL